ncbi:MAG TPA: acyltransferase [Acidimicrobiales bacterium]|nr:acyltransferase [Acidimicrobiales bacterium]
MTRSPAPRFPARLDSLTSLRWFAALFVFGYHIIFMTSGPTEKRLVWLFGEGRCGVGLFFVLSGFVLTWSSRAGDTRQAIWRRRAARILPAYWLAWLGTGVLALLMPLHQSVGKAVASFFVIQSWVPKMTVYWGWNPVAWTLSCELFFYGLFPFILPRMVATQPRTRIWLVGALPAMTIGLASLSLGVAPRTHSILDGTLNTAGWLIYVNPVARTPEFLFGMVLAVMLKDGRLPRLPIGPVLAFTGLMYVASYRCHDFAASTGFMVVPFGLLIVAVAQADLDRRPTLLRHRALVVLGGWSYCFYLFHYLILETVAHELPHLLQGPTAGVGVLAVLTAATGVAAAATILVERPAEQRLRPQSIAQPGPDILVS